MNSISDTRLAIKELCDSNRAIRESIEASRPIQRLLLAALYEFQASAPSTTTDLTAAAVATGSAPHTTAVAAEAGAERWRLSLLSLDLVELVAARLAESRTSPHFLSRRGCCTGSQGPEHGRQQQQQLQRRGQGRDDDAFDWHDHQFWALGY
jgi:hypothetical protein